MRKQGVIVKESMGLWHIEGATLVIYADGGANHVRDLKLPGSEERRLVDRPDFNPAESSSDETLKIPDFICGDLDSIRPQVKSYYETKGAKILQDPDQYSSDLTKCLKCVKSHAESMLRQWNSNQPTDTPMPTLDAVVIGGIGGRFDQGFSQLHHLYKASEDASLPNGRIFLLNPQSICFLLCKGMNKIAAPVGPGLFAENIGIIPIGRPSVISTKGLEWDVTDWHTEFGGQISTSNHIRSDEIEIETSERVLFTIELDRSDG
ncbi:MAG: hypothetical protein Q9200_007173 [Gallowayella weberi]